MFYAQTEVQYVKHAVACNDTLKLICAQEPATTCSYSWKN